MNSIKPLRTFIEFVLLALLAGSTVAAKKTARPEYAFFPPPPDAPRLQFLTGFNSEKEFRGKEEKTLMTFLTGAKPLDKSLGKPYGAAAHDKKLFICDTALGTVIVADMQSRKLGVLQTQGDGALKTPLNMAVDSDGTCYVADTGREQVALFDKAGTYLGAIGKKDETKPRDVLISNDRILIADLKGHNVRVLDKKSQNLLLTIPRKEDQTNRVRGLFTPTNLAMDSKGRVYVADSGAFRVQLYEPDGRFLRSVGEMGDGLGQFARVKGIAVDREDRLYVVDAMSQVVQIFDSDGKLLTWFGEPGNDRSIPNLPSKVLVDYEDVASFSSFAAPGFQIEHLVIVINQIGAHKVSIYGFGHKK